MSVEKLRLLKMSLENRLDEFPHMAEAIRDETQNGDSTPPIFPRPAQVTGTLYVKLLGVEGLCDLPTIKSIPATESFPVSPPRTYSAGTILSSARNFMTLPTPSHRNREAERDKEEDLSSSFSSSTLHWPRRGSRHGRSKAATLQKHHSLDHVADDSSSK